MQGPFVLVCCVCQWALKNGSQHVSATMSPREDPVDLITELTEAYAHFLVKSKCKETYIKSYIDILTAIT